MRGSDNQLELSEELDVLGRVPEGPNESVKAMGQDQARIAELDVGWS